MSMEQEKVDKIKDAIEHFSDVVNVMSDLSKEQKEELVKCFLSKHRTLQQSMMKVVAELIIEIGKFADDNMYEDLRNQQALAWAKKVRRMEQANPTYFPVI
jgi:hypothetical protein